ncbi:MAG: hypothetical protein JKY53_13405 [Flavobacteriales bacterium]|nr:hypothetical protein [Flavobacteriales bacterium]
MKLSYYNSAKTNSLYSALFTLAFCVLITTFSACNGGKSYEKVTSDSSLLTEGQKTSLSIELPTSTPSVVSVVVYNQGGQVRVKLPIIQADSHEKAIECYFDSWMKGDTLRMYATLDSSLWARIPYWEFSESLRDDARGFPTSYHILKEGEESKLAPPRKKPELGLNTSLSSTPNASRSDPFATARDTTLDSPSTEISSASSNWWRIEVEFSKPTASKTVLTTLVEKVPEGYRIGEGGLINSIELYKKKSLF